MSSFFTKGLLSQQSLPKNTEPLTGVKTLSIIDCFSRDFLEAAILDLYTSMEYITQDLIETGEDRHPETGEEYESSKIAREVLQKYKLLKESIEASYGK